ncbi:RNA polymerase sigma-70 factor [Trinickia symbiotica]|uniref:RNA polymerase sigma factor n=1 Tax=Trinickia symbiotica TaxID=863227 RepID=A0A2T3XX74_9BURK|nr:RNA polymerase sigma-70 factor [Trinickia symbiotica]
MAVERRPLSEEDPDAELVARVGRSDPAAARELVARKLPRVIALAQRMLGDRMEAEDVAQETFVRAWKQAPHWRPGEARFDTWLHRVALNLCYDRLRARRELPSADDAESATGLAGAIEEAGEPALDATLEAREEGARVRAALAALPVRQREALVLGYYQELSNIEAAGLMGITVEALESLLSRARRNMRALLLEGSRGNPKEKVNRR